MLEQAGRYFFRTRNVLFPSLLAALLITLPPVGFGDPLFNTLAGLGLAFALAGQALRVLTIGLDYIKRGGKRKRIYADRLVTGGIYAHCRNPMYTGNVLIAIGVLLIAGNPWAIAIGGVFVLFAYSAIICGEEAYLAEHFGDQYQSFVARTPRWIPRLRGLRPTIRAYRFDWPGVVVKEYSTLFTTTMLLTIVAGIKAWRGDLLGALGPWLIAAAALWIALFTWARYLKKGRLWRARGRVLQDGALAEGRRRIDLIDASILDLLNQRAIEVDTIFQWKRDTSVGRVDPARMTAMLDRLKTLNPGPLTEDDVHALSGAIIEHFARLYQPGFAPDAPRPAREVKIRTTPTLAIAASPIGAD